MIQYIFNFRWLRGIYAGYRRNDVPQRPFMMSRSGAAGIQRFGTAMWSGDIAARLTSLAAHAANQMHMSFSSIDYYGGDIGGFHRNLEGDLNEMYSQWYAYGMMFDIPGRPHVDDDTLNALGERSDGSVNHDLMIRVFPTDKGVTEEKKFTLYEDDGKTIAYQDGAVRTTRISLSRNGDDRISVTVAAAEGSYNDAPESRNIVIDLVTDGKASDVKLNGSALPKHISLADFNNADTGWIDATAHSVLAKSGAMPVSEERRFDFTLEEPNCTSSHRTISIPGESNGWRPDDPARTLSQCDGKTWSGLAEMNQESYKFAADSAWTVNWGSDGQQDRPNFPPLDGAGFYEVRFNEDDPANPVFTFVEPITNPPLQFSCENGDTAPGVSVYIMGNVPGIGEWDACRAVKLAPNGPYPTWTGQIAALPTDIDVEWKCIKRQENNCEVIQWEPGDNNIVNRTASTQTGAF